MIYKRMKCRIQQLLCSILVFSMAGCSEKALISSDSSSLTNMGSSEISGNTLSKEETEGINAYGGNSNNIDQSNEEDEITVSQRNSINILNYMSMLTQG